MTKRLYILLLMIGLVGSMGIAGCYAQAKPSSRKALEKAVKKAPGDISLRCDLIGVMLAEGDTVAAEEQLTYGLKLNQGGCLHIHHARIALSRGKRIDAAADCAQAVAAGLMPDEEAFIYQMDSLPPHLVTMRLRMAMQKDKASAKIPTGLGQLYLHQGDSSAAISAFREAYQRGDTTMLALADSLQKERNSIPYSPDPTILEGEKESLSAPPARIPFMRKGEKMEVNCTINGLKIKAEVDTTAKESTISGVETTFMLKNNYVTMENVVNDNTLIIREIDFGEGLVLRGVRLHYIRAQEGTVIFCLEDLRRLGTVVINEEKKELHIHNTQ